MQNPDTLHPYTSTIRGIVYFERLTDGWSVLRSFVRQADDEVCEEWRAYIHDDGRNRIVSNSNAGWVPSKQVRNNWNNRGRIVNQEEAIEKCDRIKYILNSTDQVDK